MSRPTQTTVSSGLESWDAAIDDNFTVWFDGPAPLYAAASQPAAGSYDDCVMVDTDHHHMVISDGSDWHIIPWEGDAVGDLFDSSGGTVGTPDDIEAVTDISSAADAIATLASKVNELLTALRGGKSIST